MTCVWNWKIGGSTGVLGTVVLSAMLTGIAPAQAEDEPLFSCAFSNGKAVTLMADEQRVTYIFGHPDQPPELVLQRPYAEVEVTPWPGVGGAIWEELRLMNGDVSYMLWGALDRMTDEHERSAGIVVERDGEELARFECLPETLDYAVFTFADAYEAAGYCWDFDAQIWQESCE
ncbi:hypothetical protein C8N42_10866 [Celeribacter persicus]|uniref:Uncharacterized protein n=1 Tax=Celeribacter persicus TaxID=1651082 RepID=A0A2T5HI85_9RHOB|nr:hypothetical protein C8N42_10866 [Celeribacter persicus]